MIHSYDLTQIITLSNNLFIIVLDGWSLILMTVWLGILSKPFLQTYNFFMSNIKYFSFAKSSASVPIYSYCPDKKNEEELKV